MSDTKARFYFAFRSPYSRIALARIAPFADRFQFLPFTGPPEGNSFANPTDNPAKRAYYSEDVLRLAIHYGLPIQLPRPFDVDFAPATLAFLSADKDGFGFAFAHAVSEARWGEGKNVADPHVIRSCADQIGWSAAKADEALTPSPETEVALRATRTAIEEDQVFGVPFMIAGGQRYWGQDRIDFLLRDMAWVEETA